MYCEHFDKAVQYWLKRIGMITLGKALIASGRILIYGIPGLSRDQRLMLLLRRWLRLDALGFHERCVS